MISLIGIFVITSSACYQPNHELIRVSSSSVVAQGEIATPVCDWIPHKWIEKVFENEHRLIELYQQCLFCEKRRIKKETWEDLE